MPGVVTYLINRLASEKLGWKTPLEQATGQVPDISALLAFRWWEPVYYSTNNGFPSTSPEKTGRWVGVADHQGDALTYLILTDDTNQVLARSSVRSALDPTNPNLRAEAPFSTTDLISDGGELEPSTTLGVNRFCTRLMTLLVTLRINLNSSCLSSLQRN